VRPLRPVGGELDLEHFPGRRAAEGDPHCFRGAPLRDRAQDQVLGTPVLPHGLHQDGSAAAIGESRWVRRATIRAASGGHRAALAKIEGPAHAVAALARRRRRIERHDAFEAGQMSAAVEAARERRGVRSAGQPLGQHGGGHRSSSSSSSVRWPPRSAKRRGPRGAPRRENLCTCFARKEAGGAAAASAVAVSAVGWSTQYSLQKTLTGRKGCFSIGSESGPSHTRKRVQDSQRMTVLGPSLNRNVSHPRPCAVAAAVAATAAVGFSLLRRRRQQGYDAVVQGCCTARVVVVVVIILIAATAVAPDELELPVAALGEGAPPSVTPAVVGEVVRNGPLGRVPRIEDRFLKPRPPRGLHEVSDIFPVTVSVHILRSKLSLQMELSC
jgi:hypothetical protein